MSSTKLSIAVATYNEEKNIGECLESVKGLANEIVVVDGSSSDKTVEIAGNLGARVLVADNPPIFHINKQKALELCSGEWILQLDADERVSSELALEIKRVIEMGVKELEDFQKDLPERELYLRHQRLLEERDGKAGEPGGEYVAFFIPRLNYFLGRFLRYGGVYPDGVIRLIKNKKAWLLSKSVHEQITVKGRIGWLKNPLIHMADPTFSRYLKRNSRYIDLIAEDLRRERVSKGLLTMLSYVLIKPISWFLLTQIKHKGILDGFPGIIFSFFSALRFPRAYWRYFIND